MVHRGTGGGIAKFAYLDVGGFTSTVVEVMELNDITRWMTTMVRDAARDWDGQRPRQEPRMSRSPVGMSAFALGACVERRWILGYRRPSWRRGSGSGWRWSAAAPSPSGTSRRSVVPRLVPTSPRSSTSLPDRAEALASATGAEPYRDVEDALRADAFDAALVMVPHDRHEEVATAVLEGRPSPAAREADGADARGMPADPGGGQSRPERSSWWPRTPSTGPRWSQAKRLVDGGRHR